ncbi:MAG: hypothetical protein J3Q66DRAFT_390159 [Benniella sp.]|nr:MAG: hypothetical protein J3Q66DRAFT_390159 [Benniella sp.]
MLDLRSKRVLELDIDHEFFFDHVVTFNDRTFDHVVKFTDNKACDFRMNTMAVYFCGATLKSDTKGDQANEVSAITADGGLQSRVMETSLRFTSSVTTSSNFVETDFQFARSTSAFNYIYNPADLTYSPESVQT